jgi:hypothetical protein
MEGRALYNELRDPPLWGHLSRDVRLRMRVVAPAHD